MMIIVIKREWNKKCVIKRRLKFNNYKDCLFENELLLKSQQIFKCEVHVYTEEIKNIALSSNDDKRLQTFDNVATYPYGENAFQVCKTELLGCLNIK